MLATDNVIEIIIRGVDDVSGPIEKIIAGPIGSIIGAAAKMATALVGAAAATGAFVLKVTEAEAHLYNVAKQLGTTTEELSDLQKVAGYADIDVDSFNQSIKFLEKNSAEAAEGVGAAADAFYKLHLNAQDFSQLPLTEKLQTLNTALAGVTDQSQKVNIAVQLFGRSGAQMLQMLDGNNAAMAELIERTKELGGEIGGQAAANAELLHDRFGEVETAIGGVFRAFADKLAPVMSGLFERAATEIASWRTAIADFTQSALTNIVTFGVVVGQIWETLSKKLSDLFSAEGFSRFMSSLGDAFSHVISFMVGAIPLLGRTLIDTFNVSVQAIVPLFKWAAEQFYVIWNLTDEQVGNLTLETFKATWIAITDLAHWAARVIRATFDPREVAPQSFAEVLFKDIPEDTAAARQEIANQLANIGDDLAKTSNLGDVLFKNIPAATAAARAQLAQDFGSLTDYLKNNLSDFATWTSKALGIDIDAARKIAEEMLKNVSETAEEAAGMCTAAFGPSLWDEIGEGWHGFLDKMQQDSDDFAKNLSSSFYNIFNSITQQMAESIVSGGNLLKKFQTLGKQALTDLIAILIRVGVERLALSNIFQVAAVADGLKEIMVSAVVGGANMFRSMAAAPFPLNLSAPIVAAGAVIAIRKFAGQLHDGIDYVPREGTYILDSGERVIPPRQNRDLTSFLQNPATAGGMSSDTYNINVVISMEGQDFLRMSPVEMEEKVAMPVIKAMNRLNRKGYRPDFANRGKP